MKPGHDQDDAAPGSGRYGHLSSESGAPAPDGDRSARHRSGFEERIIRREVRRSQGELTRLAVEARRLEQFAHLEEAEWSATIRDEVIGMLLDGWTVEELIAVGIPRELIDKLRSRAARAPEEGRGDAD